MNAQASADCDLLTGAQRLPTSLPASMTRSLSQPRLPALDALRAFAALLVVLYHIGSPKIPGGLGVLAFFVLSGFLITWLLLNEHQTDGAISLRRFYWRRALRIFPAFYAYWMLIVAGLWLSHKTIQWPQAVASFFYVNDYYQALRGDPDTALSHTWTLAVEEQFYLLWPAVLLFWAKSPAKALRVCGSTVVAVWAWRVFLKLQIGVWPGYFYEAFDTRLDALAVGCVVAIALHSGAWANLWKRLTGSVWKPLATLALLTVSVFLENHFGSDYRDLVGLLVNPLLVAVLMVQWMDLSMDDLSNDHRAWTWLNHPVLSFLGAISYSIYLYQQLVPRILHKALSESPEVVRIPLTTAAILLVASLSYFAIERPFLKLKDCRINRR